MPEERQIKSVTVLGDVTVTYESDSPSIKIMAFGNDREFNLDLDQLFNLTKLLLELQYDIKIGIKERQNA